MWGFFPCGSFSPLSILPLDFLSVSVFCHTLSPLLNCLCWVCHLRGVAGGAKWSCGRGEMDLLRMDLLEVGVVGSRASPAAAQLVPGAPWCLFPPWWHQLCSAGSEACGVLGLGSLCIPKNRHRDDNSLLFLQERVSPGSHLARAQWLLWGSSSAKRRSRHVPFSFWEPHGRWL